LNTIRQTASELGISDHVKILGTIPLRQDLMRICATCDAGLSLMLIPHTDVNLENMAGASNKPFDYLACGLAVLVSRLPRWQELFVDTGCGLDCDPSDPDSVAAALQQFCEHPDKLRAMGERGRQRILSEWNYEAQFQPVFQLLSNEVTGLLGCPAEP
jgi:glycosyltransferase involved in cell wall biosynthesis